MASSCYSTGYHRSLHRFGLHIINAKGRVTEECKADRGTDTVLLVQASNTLSCYCSETTNSKLLQADDVRNSVFILHAYTSLCIDIYNNYI